MACIGCEILVWLKYGSAGVAQFHDNRKHVESGKIKAVVYNFHCGKDVDDLQPAVKKVLAEAKSEGGLSKGVAEILEEMLIHEDPGKSPKMRPTAFQAANRFRKLLDQGPLPLISPPEVKVHKPCPAEVNFFIPCPVILRC
jgi:hypothetical protein